MNSRPLVQLRRKKVQINVKTERKMAVDEETLAEVMISEIHRPDMQRKTLKVDDMRFLAFRNAPNLVG